MENNINFKSYVEWATGNENGGTCQRPDIYLNDKSCNKCEYVEYCLCKNRKLRKK